MASKRRYGSPRVHGELLASGERCGRKRVARLMRVDGLRAKKNRRFRVTTDSSHSYILAPNLLSRQFDVGTCPANRVWAADITYLPTTHNGWLYLAVILDIATRMVVGWSVQRSLDRSLTLSALEMAVCRHSPDPGLVHHSDRGVQYACNDYRDRLADHGIVASMSRRGNCWDNAVVESFFATLKWELVQDVAWASRDDAARDLFEYIEIWYNRKRRHSSLDYLSPVEYSRKLDDMHKAA